MSTHQSQPVLVTPGEIRRVLDLLSVAGPAELTPTSIAHVIGAPVTPAIARQLMRRGGSLRTPEAVAHFIMQAKQQGNERQQQRVIQEIANGSNGR